ncbi:MAG: DUF434 domain-containing protein [Deltaproteobacteria bacterium]|nr:DUF434 domain-containing protein [Deltaproteobacteria bacterium]MBP6834613.1 DUF434 domain-containing protein [Deltaproteobacteria bacterium]
MSHGHHRSPHPEDATLFAPSRLPALQRAVEEVCWMLGRGYPMSLAVRAAGDRHQLEQRARLAVARAAASPEDVASRARRCLDVAELAGRSLDVDAFNVLITLELALGGGPLFVCADGPLRDLAGMRGSYRLAVETEGAIDLLGAALARWSVARCALWIDAPVSNSGRLRSLIEERAGAWGVETRLEMVPDADTAMRGRELVASADAIVIDASPRWCNLARAIVERDLPTAWRVPLAEGMGT